MGLEHVATESLTADAFVSEYMALVEEGWEPDLEEFVHRVPAELREEVFVGLDHALANRGEEADEEHLLPGVEIVVAPAATPNLPPGRQVGAPTRALRVLSRLVPGEIRHAWLGELLAAREDMREFGLPASEVMIFTLERLVVGLAQHAPLQPAPESSGAARNRPAEIAWFAWRASGPLLFAGYLLGSLGALASGALLLLGALGALFLCASRSNHLDYAEARLFNGVLGGCVLGISAGLGSGCLAALVVGVAAALGNASLAMATVHALALFVTAFAMLTTARGWAPQPWQPRRLVRV